LFGDISKSVLNCS